MNRNFFNRYSSLCLLPALLVALVMGACASMGRPEGGPRDVDPPVFVGANPADGALNVSASRMRLNFDENVTLKDVMSKVVVSPAQRETPSISANGRTVTIELRDSLRDSTTYTIDFSDAIQDLNEGNILDGFSYAFSTGPTIDTLAISGMVFEARTLEPAQGMTVGVYSNLSDTAITTLPLERLTKTNQLGQFTLRNLKPGRYRLYALDDLNRDYHWDRSENVAFFDVTVEPSTDRVMRTDTIFRRDGTDSVFTHPVTRFLPNDLLLTWYNLDYKPQFLSKYERPDRGRIYLEMGAKSDSMPRLRVIGGPADGRPIEEWAIASASPTRDTIEYWINDSAIFKLDSLRLETRYLRTDTNDRITWATDTLNFNLRRQKARGNGQKQQGPARNAQAKASGQTKAATDTAANDSTAAPKAPKAEMMKVTVNTSALELNTPLRITLDRPPVRFDTAAFSLSVKPKGDSVWTAVESWRIFQPDSMKPMQWQVTTEWIPEAKYKLHADSAAVEGVLGILSDSISQEFDTKALDEYSKIYFNISGLDGRPAVVELLDASDKPVMASRVPAGSGRAELEYIKPGKYYARLFIDANDNGVYDVGILDSIQPEETAYFPKRINLKKNWDLEQSWDIYATTIDMQKPSEIKKNKPKKKPGEQEESNPDDEEEEDEFGSNAFGNNMNNNRNDRGFGTGNRLGGGGFRTDGGRGGRM